mmetsp:Transcript_40105/g.93135  ORF Transcript_40105/g.93135 Transcript_40105/m.93135 type:complete len:127 (-) Transcript_40105:274-654(-)
MGYCAARVLVRRGAARRHWCPGNRPVAGLMSAFALLSLLVGMLSSLFSPSEVEFGVIDQPYPPLFELAEDLISEKCVGVLVQLVLESSSLKGLNLSQNNVGSEGQGSLHEAPNECVSKGKNMEIRT